MTHRLPSVPPTPPDPTSGRARRRLSALRNPYDAEIARLAIPAFAALVSEPLFLLADAAIVGHLGTPQLAALGIAATIISTAVGLFVFLAYGTTSTVARNLGAGDRRHALMVGVDGLWLAAGIGCVLGLAVLLSGPAVVDAFEPAADVGQYAVTYLQISAIGIPALLLMFAATGVLRGLQDTRTPLVVAVTANLTNIVLNVLFVYGFDWGIAGSAWGTVLAQGTAALTLAVVVVRAARRYDAPLAPHLRGVVSAMRTGLPLIVRTVTLRAALVLATFVAAATSTVAVAAHQVAFTIWGLLAFALDAVAIAGQAITGRLLGAGDPDGTRAATRRMLTWGIAAGVVLGLVVALSRPWVVTLFTSDREVQEALSAVLLVVALHQPVAGVVFVLDGVLIGAGDGRYLAWAGIGTLALFVPLALLVLWTDGSLVMLWWAIVAFMLARMVTLVWRERTDTWLVLGATSTDDR